MTLNGPLRGGSGDFALLNLPFSLLALLAPVPSALRGAIGATGRYNFSGQGPLITSELAFENASLGDQPLLFERGGVAVDGSAIQLDLGVRAGASNELISVAGSIPLNVDDQVDLTVESHGDALETAALAGDALQIKEEPQIFG